MSDLMTTLEAQHRALERTVEEIERALASRDAERIADRLHKLRAALEAHLSLEGSQFYPAFQTERARKHPSGGVAQIFAQNMRLIAEGLTAFFVRYANPPPDLARFEREWRATRTVLSQRIAAEEKTLHPLFRAVQA